MSNFWGAVQFAVRKGSLTPVHEGYTLADAQGRLNMYPRLVRDNKGGLIHLLTNTTCPYRRNGTRLPYGSGELAGVIVHERFPQYEYVDTADDLANGIIGSYQIRHMSFADIRFAEDRSQSFSETLTEYSYVKGKAAAADGYAYWYPTWGTNGRFTQTASKSAYPNGVYNAACWHYLGWCGTARGTAPFRSHIGNDGYSGFGVILEDGTNYAVKSTAVNTDGKGTDQANWLAWVTTYWWNASTDRPYAWVVEFSTAGLSSDRVSLIMSVQSGRATLNAGPYFWKVQWSASGPRPTAAPTPSRSPTSRYSPRSAAGSSRPINRSKSRCPPRSWAAKRSGSASSPPAGSRRDSVSSTARSRWATTPPERWTTWPYATTDNPNSKI